jgi:acyl carrier protein/SAM-dependent methyltransferase
MAREDEPGNKRLVAYVVPDLNYRGSDQTESTDIWNSEQVSQWAMTFDEAYREGGSASDATFNIAGWNSSYTNQPIPPEEMLVWVETTAERILSLRPKQVWEIGCGTGLLLFRIAPHCESFHGTDISQTALNFLHEQLQRPELILPTVSLEQKPAHEFDGDRYKNRFDTVVLNSVVHYFPDVAYLIAVVKGAVESVQPGGTVFIGDVRSLPLLEAFQTSVQLYQAPDSLTREELWRRVQKNIRQEPELVVDPRFFNALQDHIPQISSVEIQLKRGRARNELTCFRYDVILRVNSQPSAKIDCAWLDWSKQPLTPELVREILQKTEPDMLGLTAVPNARLQADIHALKMITSGDGLVTAGELREALNEEVSRDGVEPEDLWAIERELPYAVEIRPSVAAVDGCCDVVLRRKAALGNVREWVTPRFPGETNVVRPWETYANNPLRQRVASNLTPQLHRWLAGSLPEYMLPSNFLLVDSMPLSSNGKVNRKALAAIYQVQPEGQAHHVMPRTPVEEVLVSIWADVLRVDRVGTEDNFFELGGHSLTATQVVSRVRQAFHMELPLKALFESPTIAALAATIERVQRAVRGLPVPPIVPLPRNQAFPLSFAQQRLWFLHQLEPNNSLYNVPRAIRMRGTLHVQALEKALNALVQRHEVLRTNYRLVNDQPVQVISPSLTIRVPISDLSALPMAEREDEARRIANQAAAPSFNLETDPALRALLLRMAPQDHILLLNTHHISSDGWSTGVMFGDLGSLYEAALEDKPPSLHELTIQYADYAVWQRNWLQGEVLEKQLAYWKARLDGAPPLLSIPTDRPRPAVQTFRGATQGIALSQRLADGIQLLSKQQGVTLFMTMLAAFQTLLRYYTQQSDIVLGTDVANRTSVQTESLIGFFVNLLILRTDLSGDPTFHELLGRVREVALGAYEHQDVPFDKLVEEFQPERSLSHTPLVQVLFVQQNTPRQNSNLPGLKLSAFKMDVASKFDMAVFVSGTDKSLALSWLYNPDLFDASTIARMAELYQTVLEKMASNPDMKLSSLLEFLAEIEQQQRLTEEKQYQEATLSKLKKIKRRAIAEV